VVNPAVDPTFRFMAARLGREDPDGLLLPFAMAGLIAMRRPVRRRVPETTRTPTGTES